MGRKKSRSTVEQKYEADSTEAESGESSSFAEKLLSSMNISSKEDKVEVDEEAVDNSEAVSETVSETISETVSESASETEIKHPHLHSIHKSISKVFRRDSSSREGSRKSSRSVSRTGSGSVNDSEGRNTALEALTSLTKEKDDSGDDAEETSAAGAAGGKKRNRRKEKLAERERERARIVQQAQAEAQSIPDKRAIELKGMGMMITKAGLVEHEVQPDGHCLFHSLSDQLKHRYDMEVTIDEMRSALANFIRSHPDDFVPYLVEDEQGDVIDVDKYTEDLENTPLWGGELEIMAASRNYEVPVRVYLASQPPLTINEEQFADREPLTIAFYQAKFGLGAHYNSLREAPAQSE